MCNFNSKQMYEVFFNDRKISIVAKGKITINKPTVYFDKKSSIEEVKKWFFIFFTDDIPEIILIHEQPEYFFNFLFRPAFKTIYAAGGVIVRNKQLLFIYRNKKWDLPKGKIDSGETARIAALREVNEECGITGHKIIKKLPSTFHLYQSPYKDTKGELIFKETFWYEMEYSGIENGTPETKENITEIKWFSPNELDIPLKNTYANLKLIISLYLD